MSQLSRRLEHAVAGIHHRAERIKTWLAATKNTKRKANRYWQGLEPLEQRVLLSADLSYLDMGNTDTDLTLRFFDTDATYQLVDGSANVISSAPASDADVGGIVITGTSGDDTLTLDLTTLETLTLTFNGTGTDTVVITSDVDVDLADDEITAGVETFTLLTPMVGSSNFEFADITGGVSANSLTISEWSGSFSFDGGFGSDSLRGDDLDRMGDVDNAWMITGTDAGTLNGNSFTNVENLVGGLLNDTFTFSDGGSLTGSIEGGVDPGDATPVPPPAVDTLDYSGVSTPISVDAGTGTGTGTALGGGFTGIDAFVGGTSTSTLTGPQQENTLFSITGVNSGTVGNFAFSDFTDLTGSSSGGGSVFQFGSGGSLSGVVTGSGSGDSFSAFNPSTSGFTVFNPTASNATGSVSNLFGTGLTVNYAGIDRVEPLAGDDTNRQINGTRFGETVVLSNNVTAGMMEVSFSGLSFFDQSTSSTTGAFVFNVPSESLTIELFEGTDTLNVTSLDSSFAARLLLYGNHAGRPDVTEDSGIDTVNFTGSISTGGGYLEAFGDNISVADGITVSTRGATSSDPVGDIVFRARRLNVAQLENLSPVIVQDKSVSIDIGIGATLTGNAIALVAQAEDRSIANIDGIDRLVDKFVIGAAVDKLGDLTALPAKVLVRSATADITIQQNAQLIGDLAVGFYSSAATESEGVAKSKLISIGYGQATATSTVDVQSGVNIVAGETFVITSDAAASADIGTETDRDLGEVPGATGSQFALSVAVSNAEVTSHITVAETATIFAGKTANVRAAGDVSSSAGASSGLFSNGAAGLAFAIELSDADIDTRVDGTITALMNPIERVDGDPDTLATPLVKLEIDPTIADDANTGVIDYAAQTITLDSDGSVISFSSLPEGKRPTDPGYIDFKADTINIGHHTLLTEDGVSYANRRGSSIGGVPEVDDGYVVINVADDPSTSFNEGTLIKLATSDLNAIDGAAIDLKPVDDIFGDPIALNQKEFDADQVDADADTIAVDNPVGGSTFELGQAVVYRENGAAAIPGLDDGATYYVVAGTNEFNLQGDFRITDKQVIQLAESENEARAGVFIDIGTPTSASATGYELAALHVIDSGFATGIGVLAELAAEDNAAAEAGLNSNDNSDATNLRGKITNVKDKVNQGILDTILLKLTEDYDPPANSGATSNQVNVAGALGFSLGNHTVESHVGGNAVLKSNEDLEVKAEMDQSIKVFAESDTEKQDTSTGGTGDSAPTTFSIAVALGIYDNDAKATVESGAELDGLRATRVIAGVNYPLLTRFDEFVPISTGELADLVQNDGYDSVNDYLDGSLGIESKLLNTFARSTASADNLALAGSLNLLILNNDAQVTVQEDVQINQDTDWRDNGSNPNPNQAAQRSDGLGEQVVSVEATNYLQLINVTGNFQFSLPSVDISNPLSPRTGTKAILHHLARRAGEAGWAARSSSNSWITPPRRWWRTTLPYTAAAMAAST